MKGRMLGLVAATVLAACGGGSPANMVRPEDPTAKKALGESGPTVACTSVPAQADPLVVDWRTSDQLDLTVAMQNGVALVAYDCKSIRLVKGCKATGKYAFTPVPSVIQEAVQIADADEAKASLPFSGGAVGGGVATGATIDIGLAYAGKRSTVNDTLSRSDLTGSDCAAVTHFVRGASVGAFALATGTRGEVRAAAEIFGAGASGASSSSKKKLSSAGDVAACKTINGSAHDPPEGCAAVVRLDLEKIGAASAGDAPVPPALGNTCPEGFVPSGGKCAKKGASVAKGYRCNPKDVNECKTECQKGNVESCYNAGILILTGAPIDGPETRETRPLYERACEGGVGDACTRLSHLLYFSPLFNRDLRELKAAGEAAKKGCDLLVPQACYLAAFRGRDNTPAESFAFYKRACSLGYTKACMDVAQYQIVGKEGVPANPKEGLGILHGLCDVNDKDACQKLYQLYKFGKEDVKDPAKAEDVKTKACARGVSMGCPKK